MEKSMQPGINRTGVHMSPFDSAEMQDHIAAHTPTGQTEEPTLDSVRSDYIAEADAIGSIPVPSTVKGMVSTGVAMLTGQNQQLLLDMLGERMAFERAGTRLYDALITKCKADPVALGNGMSLDAIQQIRDDEANHFRQLADAIESLGGDATAQTPGGDLAGMESSGLMQVLTDPRTSITQSLNALLTAELTDEASWKLLISLAENHGQNVMAQDFKIALEEEQEHLDLVRHWYEEAILGAPQTNGVI